MGEVPSGVIAADTVTRPTDAWKGAVLVAGSHGGIYAAYCAVKAGVRGVILNDAGRGKDDAGIGGIGYCEALGIPYATIATMSARIGNGGDMIERGCPRNLSTGQSAVEAQLRHQRAAMPGDGLVQGLPLAAKPPEVGRMARVAPHTRDPPVLVTDHDAATHAAIAAGGADFFRHRRAARWRAAPCRPRS